MPHGKIKLSLSFLLTLAKFKSSHIGHFRAHLSSLRTNKKLSYIFAERIRRIFTGYLGARPQLQKSKTRMQGYRNEE
jgi:hypothetical protein